MRPENTNFLNRELNRLSRSRVSCYRLHIADVVNRLHRRFPHLSEEFIHLRAILRIDGGNAGRLDRDHLVVVEIVTRQLSQPIELSEGSGQRLGRRVRAEYDDVVRHRQSPSHDGGHSTIRRIAKSENGYSTSISRRGDRGFSPLLFGYTPASSIEAINACLNRWVLRRYHVNPERVS